MNSQALKTMKGFCPTSVVAAVALALTGAASANQEPPSLEELLTVEVTSVSKKPQKLANVAAAVHVITAEDIKLSGATSIPEALQLAPGMSVIRLNSNRWAVNARGYGDRFANKLLVLVDGRNAFNPVINGVFWETMQFPLEDIARIEVIRGPATSSWGPNGVNGVINIVTKSAASTQGTRVVVGGGNFEGVYGRAQIGGELTSSDTFYRGYVTGGNTQESDGVRTKLGNDAARTFGGGLRMDGYLRGGKWDVSFDAMNQNSDGGQDFQLPGYTPVGGEFSKVASLRGRFQKTLADGSDLQLNSSFTLSRTSVGQITDNRRVFDLDVQHRTRAIPGHDIVWGGNYRFSRDNETFSPIAKLEDASKDVHYVGAFVQDEISLADPLKLTLAVRIDDSEFGRKQVQPSARLAWALSPAHTLWSSASRATRSASRGENGLTLNLIAERIPSPTGVPALPNLVPIIYNITSPQGLGAEKLNALEIGWRAQWLPSLSSDITVFHHDYSGLRNVRTVGELIPVITQFPAIDALILPGQFANLGAMTMTGVEASVDWRVSPSLRFQIAGWYNDISKIADIDSGTIPLAVTTSFRASYSPTSAFQSDLWVRHMGGRDATQAEPVYVRRPVTAVDARFAWRANRNFEFALMGKNLTDSACNVYRDNATIAIEASRIVPTCIRRSIIAELRADF
jgi:iron complex outermembrane recepter protein